MVLEVECRNVTVLRFPGAINTFLVLDSTIYTKETAVWVRVTGNIHIHANVQSYHTHTKIHPHTKCKRVPVEQRLEQCFPKASSLVTTSMSQSHPHSKVPSSPVQSKALLGPSFPLSLLRIATSSFSFHTAASKLVCRSTVSSPSSCRLETQFPFALESGNQQIS